MFYGALCAIPAGLAETVIESTVTSNFSGLFKTVFENYVEVAVVEELFKLIVVIDLVYRNKNFDYRFDGVVYACSVAIGFSLLEDILYVSNYGISTAILRTLTEGSGHFMYAIFMGYFLAIAKDRDNKYYWIFALIVPAIFHGTYDFICDTGNLYLWITMIITFTVIGFIVLNHLSKKDQRLSSNK